MRIQGLTSRLAPWSARPIYAMWIDRARDMIVAFQTGPRHQANVEFRTKVVERYCAAHPRREALLGEFRELAW